MKKVIKELEDTKVYLFMDDHVLFFKDKPQALALKDTILYWWKLHGMEVGAKKTQWIPLKLEPWDDTMGFTPTKVYTYLGTPISAEENLGKLVLDQASEYKKLRKNWTNYLPGDTDAIDKMAFRTYYMSRFSHRVLPYLLITNEVGAAALLDSMQEACLKTLRAKIRTS